MPLNSAGSQRFYDHDPQSRLDYHIDWSTWLNGDTIESSVWTASPEGVLELGDSENTLTLSTVWVEALDDEVDPDILGTKVRILNKITTADGRIETDSIVLTIKNG